ncbi:MAG: hypothetical protein SPD47_00530 [Oscillospiraceae bacterium]|nr:hypothetical protein [Oscillospiraceae bacterium]
MLYSSADTGAAVLVFAPSPTERARETYSYFSMTVFGYGNFAPFITAVLTVVLLVLAIVCTLQKTDDLIKPVAVISGVAFVVSVIPLIFGFEYLSLVGVLISLLLAGDFSLGLVMRKYSVE